MEQDKLDQSLDIYETAMDSADRADDNVQKSLIQIKKFAAKSTFQANGKFYQVRERKGRLYMCTLEGPPKGRPKMTEAEKVKAASLRAEKKAAEAAAEAEAASAAIAGAAPLVSASEQIITTLEGENRVAIALDEDTKFTVGEEAIGITVNDDPTNTIPQSEPPAA